MRQTPVQRESRGALWAWRLAAFSFVLLVTSGYGHRAGLVDTPSLVALIGLTGLLALAALGLSWAAFARLWVAGGRGMGRAFLAAAVALAALSPLAAGAILYATHPSLADISTNTQDPPRLVFAAALRSGAMNAVAPIRPEAARLQREHYPAVTGRRYEQSPSVVHDAVREVIERSGWRVMRWPDTRLGARVLTIEMEARTLLFGFVCDVAVRISEDSGSTYVDMRSASRYGDHDFGDNARRIVRFLERLDEEMELRPPLPAE